MKTAPLYRVVGILNGERDERGCNLTLPTAEAVRDGLSSTGRYAEVLIERQSPPRGRTRSVARHLNGVPEDSTGDRLLPARLE